MPPQLTFHGIGPGGGVDVRIVEDGVNFDGSPWRATIEIKDLWLVLLTGNQGEECMVIVLDLLGRHSQVTILRASCGDYARVHQIQCGPGIILVESALNSCIQAVYSDDSIGGPQ